MFLVVKCGIFIYIFVNQAMVKRDPDFEKA